MIIVYLTIIKTNNGHVYIIFEELNKILMVLFLASSFTRAFVLWNLGAAAFKVSHKVYHKGNLLCTFKR